jgi:hypothetical protein
MRTPIAPILLAEQDLAAAELEYITRTSQGSGVNTWKNAVLTWHCEALAKARNEPWIAGLARSHDPIVDRVLRRFYRDRVSAMLKVIVENLELRRDLIDALMCIRSYQRGGSDTRAPEYRPSHPTQSL